MTLPHHTKPYDLYGPSKIPVGHILPFFLAVSSSPCHFSLSPRVQTPGSHPPLDPSCHHWGGLQHPCWGTDPVALALELYHSTPTMFLQRILHTLASSLECSRTLNSSGTIDDNSVTAFRHPRPFISKISGPCSTPHQPFPSPRSFYSQPRAHDLSL